MAINNNEYDIIIKARSNMRFEKGLAKALPNNLDIGVIPGTQDKSKSMGIFNSLAVTIDLILNGITGRMHK